MFRSPKRGDPGNLKINVAAPPNWTFAPGDTIIGTVVRQTPMVSPNATIRLALKGSTETRKEESTGPNDSRRTLVLKWDLLDSQPDELFCGPLHLADGSGECLTYPFEMKVPLGPSLTQITRHEKEKSHLPKDLETVAKHTLPGTFFSSNEGASASGSIRYNLEAELQYRRGGEVLTHTESCPVVIRHTLVDPPLVHYEMSQHSATARVHSHRLLAEGRHLSLKQKMQNLYGSSKVPEFTCRVEISAPKAVQLDHDVPIPLTLNIVGVPERTSETLRDAAVTVAVTSMRIGIRAFTATVCRGESSTDPRATFWTRNHSIDVMTPWRGLSMPLKFGIGQETTAFDIGSLCDIYLGVDGLREGPHRQLHYGLLMRSVYPDFVSYIVRHKHNLQCELGLLIAGESQTVETSAPIKVLPADQ